MNKKPKTRMKNTTWAERIRWLMGDDTEKVFAERVAAATKEMFGEESESRPHESHISRWINGHATPNKKFYARVLTQMEEERSKK